MKPQLIPHALGALALCSLAAAQNIIVSPIQSATVEGSAGNTIPWAGPTYHYMQVHSDIGGTAKVITKISFRQNASATNYTGTRAIDLELFIGHTLAYNQISQAFAGNYTTPRTNVIARKIVSFGPQGQATTPGPNAFTGMDLTLDTPFLYTGVYSLGWEVVMYSTTLTGGNWSSTDADASTVVASTTGTVTGAGCGSAMHTVWIVDNAGTLSAGFAVTGAAASQQAVLALGATNPNLALLGLCSSLQTDMLLVVPLGLTDASGAIPLGGPGAFHLPNTVPGVVLYSQIHVVDPASTSLIPVQNSNGRQFMVPVSSLTKVLRATRLYKASTTSTYSEFATSIVGYALVTQFTY